MKVTVNDQTYYMDGYLKDNLDRAKQALREDWDMLFIYDGLEGSGKSCKVLQDAYYCDPTLTLDRVVFSPQTFIKTVLSAGRYEAVVYDEAYGGLNSKEAIFIVNRAIIQMLTVIREKNLFIFIVLPTFFDLVKYVALWRSRALIHIYSDNFQRGFFRFYNVDQKLKLYTGGKKFYDYHCAKPNFIGRFTNYWVVPLDEYKHKKREQSVQVAELPVRNTDRQDILQKLIKKGIDMTQKEWADIFNVSQPSINLYISKIKNQINNST